MQTKKAIGNGCFFLSEASGESAPESRKKYFLKVAGGTGLINASKNNNLLSLKPTTFKNMVS